MKKRVNNAEMHYNSIVIRHNETHLKLLDSRVFGKMEGKVKVGLN
jgi:hypothetical protein